MANTTVNKVILGNETLLDLTGDTATAADVASGKTFHLASGVQAVGTASGGNIALTKVAEKSFTKSTESTTAVSIGTVQIKPPSFGDYSKIIYIRVRDEAGPRIGYFYGSDTVFIPYTAESRYGVSIAYRCTDSGEISSMYTTPSSLIKGYGVYPRSTANGSLASTVYMYARYNASYSLTIDGTYRVEVYEFSFPNDNPFE